MSSKTEITREGSGNPRATGAVCSQAAAQEVSAARLPVDGVSVATSANPLLALLDANQQPSTWNHWGLDE